VLAGISVYSPGSRPRFYSCSQVFFYLRSTSKTSSHSTSYSTVITHTYPGGRDVAGGDSPPPTDERESCSHRSEPDLESTHLPSRRLTGTFFPGVKRPDCEFGLSYQLMSRSGILTTLI
jgi:hypothetical protein